MRQNSTGVDTRIIFNGFGIEGALAQTNKVDKIFFVAKGCFYRNNQSVIIMHSTHMNVIYLTLRPGVDDFSRRRDESILFTTLPPVHQYCQQTLRISVEDAES